MGYIAFSIILIGLGLWYLLIGIEARLSEIHMTLIERNRIELLKATADVVSHRAELKRK